MLGDTPEAEVDRDPTETWYKSGQTDCTLSAVQI